MPTTVRRLAAATATRAAIAALALLAVATSVTPASGADLRAGSAHARGDRSWAATTIARALHSRSALAIPAADRGRLRLLPRSARVAFHPATGRVRFLASSGRPVLATVEDLRAAADRLGLLTAPDRAAPRLMPETAARAFLADAGPLLGIDRIADLTTTRVRTLPDGRSSVRLEQRRDGVPVLGGELIVGLDRRGNVTGVIGEALPGDDRVATTARIDVGAARRIAATFVARDAGRSTASDAAQSTTTTRSDGLAILDPRILGGGGPPVPRLVWQIDARATTPRGAVRPEAHQLILVDALDGAVLSSIDRTESALVRRICDFRNVRRRDFRCRASEVVRAEGDPPSGRQQVDALYRLIADVSAFYRSRFGRNGINGKGSAFVATVRYCLPTWCPMQNAFWEWGPQQTAFGDGWADVDDIVGHEFTHGVLDHEARLFYHYQSGAINESFADIFGEFIDLWNDSGSDGAAARWLIGEDLRIGAVRDMQEPGRYGDPDRVRSPQWHTGSADSGGVHSNSGVGNKAAALIADGGQFNGREIEGIGIQRAALIEYEAMSSWLTSAADYLDLHAALPQACRALIGTNGITAAQCLEVEDAVDATEMDRLPVNPARQAPLCKPGRVPQDAFADDLEHPAAGHWQSVSVADGPKPWFYPPNPNNDPNWDGTWASSGRFNIFGDDQARLTDSAMVMTEPVTLPPHAFLHFQHGFAFDHGSARYDGGIVEISVDGGAWTDLRSRFTHGGYYGTIATGFGNPLQGRRAFTAHSLGYGASRVTLATWPGQTARIRFRIATDTSGGSYGWYLDDIRIYRCVPEA